MVLFKDYDNSTAEADTASDRAHDGRYRQRGSQIIRKHAMHACQ